MMTTSVPVLFLPVFHPRSSILPPFRVCACVGEYLEPVPIHPDKNIASCCILPRVCAMQPGPTFQFDTARQNKKNRTSSRVEWNLAG